MSWGRKKSCKVSSQPAVQEGRCWERGCLVSGRQPQVTSDKAVPRAWGARQNVSGSLCSCKQFGSPPNQHLSGSLTSCGLTKGRRHQPAGVICSQGHLPGTQGQPQVVSEFLEAQSQPHTPSTGARQCAVKRSRDHPPPTQDSHSVLQSLTSQILEEDLGKFEAVLLSVEGSRAE